MCFVTFFFNVFLVSCFRLSLTEHNVFSWFSWRKNTHDILLYSIIFLGGGDTEGFHLSRCLFPSLCQGMLMRCARRRRRCTSFPGTFSVQPGNDGESWYLGNFPLACGDYFGRSGELLREGHCEPSCSLLSAINSFLLSVTQGIARERGEMERGCPVQTYLLPASMLVLFSLPVQHEDAAGAPIDQQTTRSCLQLMCCKAARETEG